MVGVFIIYDDVGDTIVSDFFGSKNQKVAMLGFETFLKDIVSKGLSKKSYSLYQVAQFDEESLTIVNSERIEVASGDNVHEKLVALGVLSDDIEEVTEQSDAIVLDNGEI